ncbi:PREDICTED: tripartite motif-containing protein 5-like [Miniopterus natalensis]|uniref:tripartite motif-containing protein 5-like n=1 Tax=Miniopterus natalensis TaxID=291302 RepID=UPI0007A6B912|nr:PREDICTED: tripartite motif-containing protein 5-like [Miniopterus natalensis]
MASGILVDIQKELTCSICLEFLTEPMSLDCGHSFCQACITANSRQSRIRQEGESSCPVCRIIYQPEKLRPNRHLVTIVEMLKEVKLSPEEEQKRDLCARHGEKLLLFCKKDGEIICWLCERSQEHRGHHTFLIEDAAQEYKKKILEALDSLKANQLKAEKWESDIRKERTSWENQIQRESKRAQDYFKQLRSILDSEEQKELQKLKEGKGDIFNDLAQTERELVQQNQLLTDLILDLERRLQGPTVGMLQNVKSIIKRSKTFTLKKPKALSKEQRSVFQAPDLSGMLQRLNELTDMRRYWVRVTLDPHRTKSNVDISADRKQVTCVLGRNTNYTYETCENEDYGVLGSPAITSGKHYWEVDVSEKRAWVLGVCAEKCLHSNRMMRSFRKDPRYLCAAV